MATLYLRRQKTYSSQYTSITIYIYIYIYLFTIFLTYKLSPNKIREIFLRDVVSFRKREMFISVRLKAYRFAISYKLTMKCYFTTN